MIPCEFGKGHAKHNHIIQLHDVVVHAGHR